MPKVVFAPIQREIEVPANTKLLAAANRLKVPIRFGCASCRCGTCAVQLSGGADLSPIADSERDLLARMKLATNGTIRLSCQARILAGTITVDLDFQDTYDPADAAAAETPA